MFFTRNKEPFKFEVTNGEATLVRYAGRDAAVTLPDTYEGSPVTEIGDSAFYDNGKLESVVLPQGLKRIGINAFRGCSGLTKISLPDSVEFLGEYAFSGCKQLKEINFSSALTAVPSGAFSKCRALERVKLPGSVTSIGDEAFSGCASLKNANAGMNVTSLGEDAFKGCSDKLCLVLPEALTVSDELVHSCERLYKRGAHELTLCAYTGHDTSLSLDDEVDGEKVTAIGDRVFAMFAYLESVRLPRYLTSIGDFAFAGCSGLTQLDLPDTLESIGKSAFSGCGQSEGRPGYISVRSGDLTTCTGLTSVTLPASVKSVGENAFFGCVALNEVKLLGSDTYLGSGSFSMCSVRSFAFPAGTKEIQTAALRGCALLESVTIPEGVECIWERAFEGCVSLKTVQLPESLEVIGEGAFSNLMALNSIYIPARVREIADEALAFTPQLSDIGVATENARFEAREGCLIDKAEKRLIACAAARQGSFTVPGDIEVVGALAFSASGLSELTLPASIKRVGDWALRASGIKQLNVLCDAAEFGTGILLDTEDTIINASEDVKARLLGDEG